MDYLQFISAMVSALAWPAALLGAVFVFRRPISDRLANLTKVSGAGFEAAFEASLASAEIGLREAVAENGPALAPVVGDGSSTITQTSISTTERILLAWRGLEEKLRAFALNNDVSETSVGETLSRLAARKAIPHGLADAIRELMRGRTAVTFYPSMPPTEEAAARYATAASLASNELALLS